MQKKKATKLNETFEKSLIYPFFLFVTNKLKV